MNQDPDDLTERPLSDLFEQAAPNPSGSQRTRLSAHAAAVAQRGRQRRYLDRRVAWPAALGAAAAISYLVVAPPRGHHGTPVASPATVPAKVPGPSGGEAQPNLMHSAFTAGEAEGAEAPETDDPFAATAADDLDEFEPLELGPLFAPNEPERREQLATAVEHMADER